MKKKALVVILAVAAVAIGVTLAMRRDQPEVRPAQTQAVARQPDTQPPPTSSHASHQQMSSQEARVPAHFETAPSKESLAPTLAPEQFTGPTRAAYMAAQEIPQTLAQLPCYCHCDIGFGHKSLHSCFETDHGAHCAVCVNEALLAYQMEKNGLTPTQIRERIVAQYASQQ